MLEARTRDDPDLAIQAAKRITDQANTLVRKETTSFLSARTFPPGT